jgi:cytochrome b6-f complex iron-sulfur subunit
LGTETRPTRRSFLDALLGLSVVAWVGSILFPALRYLTPIAASGPGGPVKLAAEEVAKLEKERFVIVRAGASKILVLKDGSEQIRALSAKCTHEGCTVQFVPGDSVIWCACHNGRFDLDGRVLAGPPPRPLPRYAVQRKADGSIAVTPEEA